jgi:hypothetical protein
MEQMARRQIVRSIMPTRMLGLLMAIGFIDLVATAYLHSRGLIVELNPVMKPIIESSEFLFALVKGMTLVLAWVVMAKHAQKNLVFVRKVCLVGAIVYLGIWTTWFLAGTFGGAPVPDRAAAQPPAVESSAAQI